MPKNRELLNLFSAIGARDLTRASAISRTIASKQASRGNFRAERDMLTALNGKSGTSHSTLSSEMPTAWSTASSLMPLKAERSLSQLELLQDTKESLEEIIHEWKFRSKLAQHNLPRRWRLLFHGPSGCGKSASAAALAHETGLPCYLVRFDTLIGAFLGQTALRLRELFTFAEANPCVLLFDEVDALAKRRGSPMEVGELDRIVIAFMQELEHARGDGLVIATSNLPDALDAALWRRFDLRVAFPKPTIKQLEAYVRKHAQKLKVPVTKNLLLRSHRESSYADAEQLVLSEARFRVLRR